MLAGEEKDTAMKTIMWHRITNSLITASSGLSLRILLLIFLITLSTSHAEAFQAKVIPSNIHTGDAFMLRVTGLDAAEPSAVFEKTVLHFSKCGKGCFVAIGAVDIKSRPGVYLISLKTGQQKTELRLRVLKGSFKTIHLTLPEEKVTFSPEDLVRIDREDEMLGSIWQIESERLWDGSFILPLPHPFSTPFGTKRIINKKTVSLHRGLDMQGKAGEKIWASNRGRVVLTEELFFGGNTVILDHGQGIFTVYMHMSGFNVKPGDIVSKSDVIGFVGSSGRSSGPHLHFGVKVMRVNANPVSIAGLKL
ncbi:MAG: M23 family metallopeptidase [Thermodesulfovibrionales bacterium]|nr:M23 family metallopeptidase [Thermodesulfovibrionales bacterium]